MSLFVSRTFSVIGLCSAGSQRCGVPAGFAGVEEGEEGDEVRVACCEQSESFTVALRTQPTRFPQGRPEVGLETALLGCGGWLWPPGSRTSQLPLVMSDISLRQQRAPSHFPPTPEFVVCLSLPTSIPPSVPLNFPVWAARSPAWPVGQCWRWLCTAVNPWGSYDAGAYL